MTAQVASRLIFRHFPPRTAQPAAAPEVDADADRPRSRAPLPHAAIRRRFLPHAAAIAAAAPDGDADAVADQHIRPAKTPRCALRGHDAYQLPGRVRLRTLMMRQAQAHRRGEPLTLMPRSGTGYGRHATCVGWQVTDAGDPPWKADVRQLRWVLHELFNASVDQMSIKNRHLVARQVRRRLFRGLLGLESGSVMRRRTSVISQSRIRSPPESAPPRNRRPRRPRSPSLPRRWAADPPRRSTTPP